MADHDLLVQNTIENFIRYERACSTLVTGRGHSKFLRSLYERTRERYPAGWIESAVYEEFLDRLLMELRLESPENESQEIKLARAFDKINQSRSRYNLFIPNADRLFYESDIAHDHLLGASLRKRWQHDNLNLHFSASRSSKQYKSTFDRYEYPLWINNFHMLYLN